MTSGMASLPAKYTFYQTLMVPRDGEFNFLCPNQYSTDNISIRIGIIV